MNRQGKDGIEYCDYTMNPIGGCEHDCAWLMPDGSRALCYAGTVANRVATAAYPQGFKHLYWRPETLEAPGKVVTSARIFCGSMADMFGAWVPEQYIQQVIDMTRRFAQHTYLFLTKNPARYLKFEFPPNVWLGASLPPSAMNGHTLTRQQQEKTLISTLTWLATLDGHTRWLSLEPLSWDCSKILEKLADVEWVVIGAASSGRTIYQPPGEWVKRAVAALRKRRVKIFYKGNLKTNPAATPWLEEYPAFTRRIEPVQQALF